MSPQPVIVISDEESETPEKEQDFQASGVCIEDDVKDDTDSDEEDMFEAPLRLYKIRMQELKARLAVPPPPEPEPELESEPELQPEREPEPARTSLERPAVGRRRRKARPDGEQRRKRRRRQSAADLIILSDDELDAINDVPPVPAAEPCLDSSLRGLLERVTRSSETADAEVERVAEEPAAADPEPRPVTARVRLGVRVIRLKMDRSEKLQRLFETVAREVSLPADRVRLGQRDLVYSPQKTPDDVGLGAFDMIDFWEGRSAAPAEAVDPDSIEVKLQSAQRRSTVLVRILPREPMSVLMAKYAATRAVPVDRLRFRFDGDPLAPDDTPESLGLEGGECVDVYDV